MGAVKDYVILEMQQFSVQSVSHCHITNCDIFVNVIKSATADHFCGWAGQHKMLIRIKWHSQFYEYFKGFWYHLWELTMGSVDYLMYISNKDNYDVGLALP